MFEGSTLCHFNLKVHAFSFMEKSSYTSTASHMEDFAYKRGQRQSVQGSEHIDL